jgi:hypothetical protein
MRLAALFGWIGHEVLPVGSGQIVLPLMRKRIHSRFGRIASDAIAEHGDELDNLRMLQQLGVIPAPQA